MDKLYIGMFKKSIRRKKARYLFLYRYKLISRNNILYYHEGSKRNVLISRISNICFAFLIWCTRLIHLFIFSYFFLHYHFSYNFHNWLLCQLRTKIMQYPVFNVISFYETNDLWRYSLECHNFILHIGII